MAGIQSNRKAGITNNSILRGVTALALLLLMILPGSTFAKALGIGSKPEFVHPRPKSAVAFPVYESRLHYAGQVWLAITTWGLLGTEGANRVNAKDREVLSIDYSPSFEFPAGTRNDYLYGGGLWVGGIVGPDTLVSFPLCGVCFVVV